MLHTGDIPSPVVTRIAGPRRAYTVTPRRAAPRAGRRPWLSCFLRAQQVAPNSFRARAIVIRVLAHVCLPVLVHFSMCALYAHYFTTAALCVLRRWSVHWISPNGYYRMPQIQAIRNYWWAARCRISRLGSRNICNAIRSCDRSRHCIHFMTVIIICSVSLITNREGIFNGALSSCNFTSTYDSSQTWIS